MAFSDNTDPAISKLVIEFDSDNQSVRDLIGESSKENDKNGGSKENEDQEDETRNQEVIPVIKESGIAPELQLNHDIDFWVNATREELDLKTIMVDAPNIIILSREDVEKEFKPLFDDALHYGAFEEVSAYFDKMTKQKIQVMHPSHKMLLSTHIENKQAKQEYVTPQMVKVQEWIQEVANSRSTSVLVDSKELPRVDAFLEPMLNHIRELLTVAYAEDDKDGAVYTLLGKSARVLVEAKADLAASEKRLFEAMEQRANELEAQEDQFAERQRTLAERENKLELDRMELEKKSKDQTEKPMPSSPRTVRLDQASIASLADDVVKGLKLMLLTSLQKTGSGMDVDEPKEDPASRKRPRTDNAQEEDRALAKERQSALKDLIARFVKVDSWESRQILKKYLDLLPAEEKLGVELVPLHWDQKIVESHQDRHFNAFVDIGAGVISTKLNVVAKSTLCKLLPAAAAPSLGDALAKQLKRALKKMDPKLAKDRVKSAVNKSTHEIESSTDSSDESLSGKESGGKNDKDGEDGEAQGADGFKEHQGGKENDGAV